MANDLIEAVTMSQIKESSKFYTSPSVDALLERERQAAIARENAIKDLISEQDDTFDDMSQSLSAVVNLDDLVKQIYTTNDLYERVNILTRCLKQLYNALLGE